MLFSFKKCSKIGTYVPKILENDFIFTKEEDFAKFNLERNAF